MSQTELERMRFEEEALRRQLEALSQARISLEAAERERIADEKRAEALQKPVLVIVSALAGGSLLLLNDYREDILEIFKSTFGRSFRGYAEDGNRGKNLIPLTEWEKVEARLRGCPNLTLEWAPKVQEELEWYLTAPPWEIILHPSQRHFLVKMGPRQSGYHILSHIPGADWDWDKRSWKVGLSEGWRVFEALEKIDGVIYSDEARALIFRQVESRMRLDKIARQTDTDFITELNGLSLRPFQRVGVEFIYESGGRTLLADDTGLGKTWQGLAYAEKRRTEVPGFQTLIVAKAANIANWKREIRRLTNEEPIQCVSGKPDYFILKKITEERVPYVLISYDTLGLYMDIEEELEDSEGVMHPNQRRVYTWAMIFGHAEPNLMILDEAHQIKNPDAHRTKAALTLKDIPHIIPMTASPVLNRTEELWPLLHLLDKQMFKSHSQFLDAYTYNGRVPKNSVKLHEMLRPMFLRRKKSDVLKDLPPINRITHLHELSPRAAGLYEQVLRGIYEELAEYDPWGVGGAQMKVISILAQITRLKQICAADKTAFTAELATDLIDQHENGGKVLIFSQFKGTALRIAQLLGHEAICTVRRGEGGFISMNATQRDELFESARNDPGVRYVVTTEAAKEGHNLEFCNWVIFNDPLWTPAGHHQCEGRAYGRLSDPHPIDALYVIADVDVEKWIMELLEKKLGIIREAVEGIESTRELGESVGAELIRRMKEAMWTR